jgi:hypothetical protein
MQNIRLNPGGVIGAILLLLIVIVFVMLNVKNDHDAYRGGIFAVIALLLGAFGGNCLWSWIFPKGK